MGRFLIALSRRRCLRIAKGGLATNVSLNSNEVVRGSRHRLAVCEQVPRSQCLAIGRAIIKIPNRDNEFVMNLCLSELSWCKMFSN